MRIEWTRRAEREGSRLPARTRERIVAALDRYAETESGDVRKLADVDPPEWRLRVGAYRVRFRRRGDVLEVLHVLRRDRAYRRR